jgi:hypothetical protein
VTGSCECGNEPSCSIKDREVLESWAALSFSRSTVLCGSNWFYSHVKWVDACRYSNISKVNLVEVKVMVDWYG